VCPGQSETLDVHEQPEIECPEGERRVICHGNWSAHCAADGDLVELVDCAQDNDVCVPGVCDDADACNGCRRCEPGTARCGDDGERRVCRDDGSGFDDADACDVEAGELCSVEHGICEDLCAAAEAEQSYIGCEYWAVATSNSLLDYVPALGENDGICRPFSFAVVIANAEGIDANITIETPGYSPRTLTVKPGTSRAVELPCSPELKGDPNDVMSVQVPDGAHHILSDVPVTVYQFNPLEYRAEVDVGSFTEDVYSYTNDASLLLPVHSLTGNYRVMSRATRFHRIVPHDPADETRYSHAPGFVTIVGVEDEPTEVVVTSTAHTRASEDGELPALAPGDELTVVLAKGEVLQLVTDRPDDCEGDAGRSSGEGDRTYCDVGDAWDLTGTRINAQARVAVIAGHDCAFIPFDRWACDHLEEMMFPVEAWGREVLVGVAEATRCQEPAPSIVRVLSDVDGNRIRFTPAVRDPVTLDRGEFIELETTDDLRVSADGAILVGQFLVGQDFDGRRGGTLYKGDPAFSLAIPREQWRTRYGFLAPETFSESFVNVIGAEAQVVLLDGRAVRGFTPIEGTDLATARVPIDPGAHTIESDFLFGIVVYGYASYTSFMVPGGLDLNRIYRPD
jgi:hypothetical protein